MRRTINGTTYDTAQARSIVSATWTEETMAGTATADICYTLYQTAEGTLFLHIHSETAVEGERGRDISDELVPCNAVPGGQPEPDILDLLAELLTAPVLLRSR